MLQSVIRLPTHLGKNLAADELDEARHSSECDACEQSTVAPGEVAVLLEVEIGPLLVNISDDGFD